jgi:hypothetical protein
MGFAELLLEDADEAQWEGNHYHFEENNAFPFAIFNISADKHSPIIPCLFWKSNMDGAMHVHLYIDIEKRKFGDFEFYTENKIEAEKALKSPDCVFYDAQGVAYKLNRLSYYGSIPIKFGSTIGRIFIPEDKNTLLITTWDFDWMDVKPFLTYFFQTPPIAPISDYTEKVERVFLQLPENDDDQWTEIPLQKLVIPQNAPKLDLPDVKKRILELQTKIHLMTGLEKKRAKTEIVALNRVLLGKISLEDAQELIDSVVSTEEEEAFGSWQYGRRKPLNLRQKATTSESLNT